MNREFKTLIRAILLSLLTTTSVFAFPDQNKATIGVTGDPVAVAVSPDDRWVFVASNSSGAGTVYFIDTLQWQVVASHSLAGGSGAVDVAVSTDCPDQTLHLLCHRLVKSCYDILPACAPGYQGDHFRFGEYRAFCGHAGW